MRGRNQLDRPFGRNTHRREYCHGISFGIADNLRNLTAKDATQQEKLIETPSEASSQSTQTNAALAVQQEQIDVAPALADVKVALNTAPSLTDSQ
jgi:hypothetical protein